MVTVKTRTYGKRLDTSCINLVLLAYLQAERHYQCCHSVYVQSALYYSKVKIVLKRCTLCKDERETLSLPVWP